MSDATEQYRFCARCGREMPPRATIGICTRCALLEAEGSPTAESVPLFFDDVSPGGAEVRQHEAPGQMIGRYKLLEKVGEGGCGVVYVAEQQEPIHRRVAIKVIKLGMDTRAVVARFEAERQALAMMDHPNIAKVLDAGATETGRPYFVMELVRGIRITDYCDQANLSTKDRLGLFTRVCQAIQHAHQKGIIHRDIKPSNILVTLHDGVPVPKVIDFGIAKATEGRLTDKTVYTQLHQFVGTPAYMSPEQAEMSGLDIDTRSDIYSLGVLLYEILTGQPPFDPKELLAAGLDAMRRTIRETEPMRPSTRLAALPDDELTTAAKRRSIEAPKLVHQVKGDLDWIVMRCLEKDRTRRYETANGLATDIQRHLENEPVTARPPSAAYRFQKMVRRHRTAFVGTVVVALALVFGLSAAVIGFVQATRAKAKEVELRKQAQAQELATRRRAYAAEMNSAFHSLAENNLGHVLQILDRQRPKPGEEDLRGFEWRLLWQKARRSELMSWPTDGSSVFAYSPDNAFLASAEKEIVIRDAKTKQPIARLPASADRLSFSPDSRLLASSGAGSVQLWDTRIWKQVRSLQGASSPIQFSPDGRWLISGHPDGYCLWNTSKWEASGFVSGRSAPRSFVEFSPDSEFLLTSWVGNGYAAHELRIWRVPSMLELAPLEISNPLSNGYPCCASFSPDGRRVLIGKDRGQITVHDFKTRLPLNTWQAHKWLVQCMEKTKDGKRLITGGGDHTVQMWDLETHEQIACLGTHVGEVEALAVSPDGQEVIAGSRFPPEIKLWSTSPHGTEPRLGGADSIVGILDNHRLLVDGETGLKIWDPANNSVQGLPTPDGFPSTDKAVFQPTKSPWKWLFALKPDGSIVALGRTNGTVEFWSLASRARVLTWQAHQDTIFAVSFSRDGKTFASADKHNLIKFWNSDTQAELFELTPSSTGIQCLAFSPDDRLLACGTETGLELWELASRKRILHSDSAGCLVPAVAFSPDGNFLAATDYQQAEVEVWDSHRGRLMAVLKGQMGGAANVAFSPDGRTLASSGLQVKLWNIPTFLEVATLESDGITPWSLHFSPDGEILAIGYPRSKTGMGVSFWHAPSLAEIDRIDSAK